MAKKSGYKFILYVPDGQGGHKEYSTLQDGNLTILATEEERKDVGEKVTQAWQRALDNFLADKEVI